METFGINDDQLRKSTISKFSSLGCQVTDKLKLPRKIKQDEVTTYAHAVTAVLPPTVIGKESEMQDFEPDLTSNALLDMKKQKRFEKMREFIEHNPLMVVPKHQLPRVPGLTKNEECTFEMFLSPVKPVPNFKRDLRESIEERWKNPISNIKLPELKGDGPIVLQIGKLQNVQPSEALKFDKKNKMIHSMFEMKEDESDLDRALMNIRKLMAKKNLKMQTISIQTIDQIYRFATLNNFENQASLEEMVKKEMERIQFGHEELQRRKMRARGIQSSYE